MWGISGGFPDCVPIIIVEITGIEAGCWGADASEKRLGADGDQLVELIPFLVIIPASKGESAGGRR